jgi:hypothetical protein
LVHPTISQHDHFLTLKKKCKGSKKQNRKKKLVPENSKRKIKTISRTFQTIWIGSLMTTMSRTKRTRNLTKRNPGIGTSSMIIYVTNKKILKVYGHHIRNINANQTGSDGNPLIHPPMP